MNRPRRPYEVPLLVALLAIPILWLAPRSDMPTQEKFARDRSIRYFEEHRQQFEQSLTADPKSPVGLSEIMWVDRTKADYMLFAFPTGNGDPDRCIGYTPHSTKSIQTQFFAVRDFAIIDDHWFYIVYG